MAPFYLLFGFYGLLLLATPFLAIWLYFKNAKLKQQLTELVEENAKQHTKLQRAIGELQTKIGATVSPAAEKPVAPEVSHPSAVPVPRSYPHVLIPSPITVPPRVQVQPPIKPPAAPIIPAAEEKPHPAPEQKPVSPTPSAPVPTVTATPPTIPSA